MQRFQDWRLPGYPRRRARRQVRAIRQWGISINQNFHNTTDAKLSVIVSTLAGAIASCLCMAEGYFQSGDWVGVEQQYLRARRRMDDFSIKNWPSLKE